MKYRIKVETTNGGDVRHTPQFGKPKLTIGKRSVYPWLDWYNIVDEYGILNLEKGRRILYKTEEEALRIIEWYKNVVRRKEAKEIKSVEYIDID